MGAGGTVSTGGGSGSNLRAPSCTGLALDCGPQGVDDCCASPLVAGGTFFRSCDAVTTSYPGPYTSTAYPATVSNFRLDKYEITVGRFRQFVAAYSQNLVAAAAGRNSNDPSDPGWDTAWNENLPVDSRALTEAVKCDAIHQTWTDTAGANENKPVNCLNWYEAYAFCIWDGGRLATEAEWNYAAAGGSEQRVYPWSKPSTSTLIDCSYANYYGGPGYCVTQPDGNGTTDDVGSQSPLGDGRFGQADLGGNVFEWVLDWFTDSYSTASCSNCANITPATVRVSRGGSYFSLAENVLSSYRGGGDPALHWSPRGARCARDP